MTRTEAPQVIAAAERELTRNADDFLAHRIDIRTYDLRMRLALSTIRAARRAA